MYNERILQYEHETMGKEIRDLLYRYQGNIWLDSVGRSFDDREIYRIIVGNRTAEKKILFTGAIHGREYMTAKLLVKQTEHFLQYMCEGGNEDFDVAVHVIPMVNPDGAALCHRGIEGIRKKELKEKLLKIKEKEDFVRWKSNARGVDLNRNFDAFWNEYSCEKQKPSAEKYTGASPESEVETKALTRLTRKEKFQATISYHSSGEVIYWDFGQQGKLREDTKKLAKVIGDTTGYEIIDGWDKIAPAGYKDWALLEMKIPSVTIEIGKGDSPLSENEFPEIWEKNKDIWKNILRIM